MKLKGGIACVAICIALSGCASQATDDGASRDEFNQQLQDALNDGLRREAKQRECDQLNENLGANEPNTWEVIKLGAEYSCSFEGPPK